MPPPIVPSVPLLSPLLGAPAAQPKPGKAVEAARQFEGMLLAKLLQSGRESASNLGGDDEDSENSTMLEFAEQQLATMLAQHGGIGLARIVTQGLEAHGGDRPAPAPAKRH